MPAPAVIAFFLALAVPPDTIPATITDSITGPVYPTMATAMRVSNDTVQKRRRAVEISDWYERRLRIHRYGSYTIYPLFALQAIAGNQLYQDPRTAPEWAKTTHRASATALAGVFTVNTATGLWNLWDSRAAEKGRARRTVHALLMLASDAGFTYAGAKLSNEAENSIEKRRQHRAWAYGSMTTALTGVAVMTLFKED